MSDDLQALVAVLAEQELRQRRNWLANYRPYAKQREFHAAGEQHRERLLVAGNQLGKTYSGAAEVGIHMTGRYPPDWPGRRFSHAIRAVAGSESLELTRKGVQRLLVGPPEDRAQWGTGAIPYDAIKGFSMRQGVPDTLSSIVVQHVCGDRSVLQFASYDQGRTKWQADTLDLVWMDEEPPPDVYSEALTRITATRGCLFVTFTPLKGRSEVVTRYMDERPPGTHVTTMTIDDAEHFTPEERAAVIAGYPEHEREARAKGIPMMGSGRVFPVAESAIQYDPFPIPAHWARIVGLDFGWDHPAAAVWIAHDRDTDTAYVYDAWCARETPIDQQALVLRKGGEWIPVAWPHDGLQHEKGSGLQLAAQYRAHNVNMLKERATFTDGTSFVEPGVTMMLDRMRGRRLLVAKHLSDWFQEFRMYHRKEGLIVKRQDDLMSATRYALMMLRKAVSQAEAAPGLFGTAPRLPAAVPLDIYTGY
jgi:phage terminase large subunit-like protein